MHWLQRNIADTWTEAQSATIAACRVPRTQKPTEKPTSQPRAGPTLGNHCRHTHRIETTPEGTTRASRTPMGHTPVPVLGTPQAAPTRAMPPHACAHLISTTNAGGLRAGRLPTAVPPHAYDKPHKPRPRSASRTLHTTKTHDTHASATTGADATPATPRTHPHHDNAEPLRRDAERSHPSKGDTYAKHANDPVGIGTRVHPAGDAE